MNTNDRPLRRQLRLLCLYEGLRGFRIAGAIWVVLLLGRGYTLAQVGLAEAVFHGVSLICEVPSGMLADLMGRKRTLVCAGLVSAASGAAMAASSSWLGVCIAMGLEALGFNLASGTLEAITYDSLKQASRESDYVRWDGRLGACFSALQALACLGSFITVRIGFSGAYAAAACIGLGSALAASRLTEPVPGGVRRQPVPLCRWPGKLAAHTIDNVRFLLSHPRLAARMLAIGIVSAASYLMEMFWQDHLLASGLPAGLVGTALFGLMAMDTLGALAAPRLPGRLRTLFCSVGPAVAVCAALAGLPSLWASLLAAPAACLLSTAFLTRADSLMQPYYPSESRATLTSVNNMVYSLCMVALSPAAGLAAGLWGAGPCLALIGLGLAAVCGAAALLTRLESFGGTQNEPKN